MGADHFRDKRIEATNQFASRLIVVLKRGCDQSACIKIIHVRSVSTPLINDRMRTASVTPLSDIARGKGKKCNQFPASLVFTYETSAWRSHKRKQMKRNLLTLAAVGAIALSGFALVQAQDKGGFGWHGHGNALNHLTKTLNLTPDQQAKVQPILDQAKPQLKTIHQEARQKAKAGMDSTMSQIRPLLNADQQKKLDDLKAAHQQMRDAMQKMHDAQNE